jgi:hypothetical protein
MLRLRSLLAIMEGVAEPETEEADHQSPETKEVEVGRGLTHLLVGTVPPQPIVPEKHRPGPLTPLGERTDGEAVESDPGSILRNAKPPPENDIPDEQKIFFTFHAQLTYGLKKGTKIHLPDLFRQWVEISYSQIPDFALLPFDDELGQAIHTPDQVPEDDFTFYKEYYHNHRVLQHGNLTGMIHFRCSVSWNKIKRVQDEYFQWLHANNVYLNLTKFKTDTLVVSGFFVGAHPGHLRREDARQELRARLNLPPEFQFQLSSRTISVPMLNGTNRYSFPAVAIETSARLGKHLREAMFSLPKPSDAKRQYPYTGIYQFVPVLTSKEWPIQDIPTSQSTHQNMPESASDLLGESTRCPQCYRN